ncbi:hypothetical protein SmJEL517_g01192 [Synchytrium microbalum]|uniref:Cwf19-like C-terminal domain-containing protein n=1 Tax=Synchytrium microbalum TaxID=1806994 RepID=A0A507CAM4_9FUNG|nr:uncharacterized protein SmJEL517_g01192 [Synchytrium microbalum]TPX36672.1 hypothetical protein SmJEL517_g01192 [Synchytrium microbalum]
MAKKSKKDKKKKRDRRSSDDSDVSDEWVEKPAAGSEQNVTNNDGPAATKLVREDWLLKPPGRNPFEITTKDVEETKPAAPKEPSYASKMELNPFFANDGSGLPPQEDDSLPASKKRKFEYGDSGSSWRMMKLDKVSKIAEDEKRRVEEVALERYGSLDEYEDALAERSYLNEQRRGRSRSDEWRQPRTTFAFGSGNGERFKRPSDDRVMSPPDTWGRGRSFQSPSDGDSVVDVEESSDRRRRSTAPTPDERDMKRGRDFTHTPIIPILSLSRSSSTTPTIPAAHTGGSSERTLSINELNSMHSKVLKAKLAGLKQAEVEAMEEEYQRQKDRFETSQLQSSEDIVIPNIDSRGRLQDTGVAAVPLPAGVRRKKEKVVTHDETGQRIRYFADDDRSELADMVLKERMAGKSYDESMAERIAGDSAFKDDLEYMDESLDNMPKRSEPNDAKKRSMAINEYQKTQSAHDKCWYCMQEGQTPKVPVLAVATKTYLALPSTIQMTPGHCLIVPTQHTLTSLECEDDVWDEIRNFMKCLIQMFAKENKSAIFMEQVVNLKWQRHTVIECIPIDADSFEDAPQFFKEAINSSDEEWSQHTKLIDTSKYGFRKSMVKNLPYFHVWLDPNKGYGHVIENDKEWPEYFGKSVLASMMDLPPDKWRKPRRMNRDEVPEIVKRFEDQWKPFDWTAMLRDE